jgi:hypothetical protein
MYTNPPPAKEYEHRSTSTTSLSDVLRVPYEFVSVEILCTRGIRQQSHIRFGILQPVVVLHTWISSGTTASFVIHLSYVRLAEVRYAFRLTPPLPDIPGPNTLP